MTSTSGPTVGRQPDRGAVAAWCLYDWANSGFPTVVITFVFSAYVTKYVAESETLGTAQWGTAISLSALAVAIFSPLLGAIADNSGRRKPWLLAFTGLCVLMTFGLWTIKPEPTSLLPALVLVAVGNAAFEFGQVFYNAMLPDVAPRHMLGRVSGWAWSCGYYGGLAALTICLFVFALPEEPVFGLDKESFEQLRITGPFVALWFALFALPLFLVTPDRPASGLGFARAARQGVMTLIGTFRQLPRYRNIARFLLARMVYTDGLNTLFVFGGIYAANTFGMDFAEILTFGILLNITAGLGAFGFAWLDDWIGSKRTIVIAVAGLTLCAGVILVIESKLWFYVTGCILGIFTGPAQAASRTLMARLAPREMLTEMFGLYAFSGKATAFLGPILVGWATLWTDSQRLGMATIPVFLVVGLILLLPVREPGAGRPNAGSGACR